MQDYLDISLTEPDASLTVKRWRARCRRNRQTSVVVVRKGAVFYLEVRQDGNCLAPLSLDMIQEHPGFEFAGGGSSSGRSHSFSSEGMPLSSLDKIVALVRILLETTQSDEMREALRRPRDPIAPLDEPTRGHTIWSISSGHSYAFVGPRLRLRFPRQEYECWQACLAQLFDGMPRPLPLRQLTAGRYFYSATSEEPLDRRFEGLCAKVDADWRAKLLPFHIDLEAFEPGAIKLQEEGIVVSRPGFSRDGEEAVFWLNGPLLSGYFRGLVRARREDGQWRVLERSYDEDWEPLSFEPRERPHFRSLNRLDSDWEWTCAHFQETEPSEGFYSAEELQACNARYQSLVENGDERRVIPMLHGPPMSVAQLKRQREILWTSTPSRTSEGLARAGQAIVRWGEPGSPQWLGKLLYQLDQQVPCRFFESVWAEAPVEDRTEPHRKSLMNLLEAIFTRAGCAHLRCRHTADDRHSFGWQAEGGGPMRVLGSPSVFDQPGTLWMHISHRGFSDGIFEILGGLCSWGDPERKWTQRLWRAAVIESAWSGIDEEN